uniref:tetratricopeptide repeat protein n=1 Tax=Thaumasiovibrio occultus TaxID=1891184 RepID=UPI000B34AB83|nr:tetratricopeptide repeat protein [Thaumasiovibrio occultus]
MKIQPWLFAVTLLLAQPFMASQAGAVELSQGAAAKVQRAQELYNNGNMQGAIQSLSGFESSRPSDTAYVNRMLGIFHWQAGNGSAAIKHLKLSLDSDALPAELNLPTRQMLADFYLTEGQYRSALTYYYPLTRGYGQQSKRREVWWRIAQSHYQLEEWAKTIDGLAGFESNGGKMTVNHYRMRLGSQLNLQRWKGATQTLEKLIALEPREVKWFQHLANLQLRTDNPRAAMETLAIAHHNRLGLTHQDLNTLVQLYANQGLPDRAARLYTDLNPTTAKEFAKLANYWQLAKEWDNAIAALKRAVEGDNQYRLRLAQLQLQQQYYEAALANLNLVSGGGDAIVLCKIQANYQLERYSVALSLAQQAYAQTSSSAFESWVNFLQSKIDSIKAREADDAELALASDNIDNAQVAPVD